MAVAVAAFFLFAVDPQANLKASEVHLASATVIGAALALVLSLSIIPAQRASEAFAYSILQLYARDRWLLAVFIILVVTTLLSVLLGTNWYAAAQPKASIAIQFVLLGLSLDALRRFYIRVLNLLLPQTAVSLVTKECLRQLGKYKRIVERFVRVQEQFGTIRDEQARAARAILYSQSNVPAALRIWVGQLDEFAHKMILRRDTHAANDIVAALGTIGLRYMDVRRDSLVLVPDWDNLLAGGISDVTNVLNPILETVRVICEDAVKSANELVAIQCIKTLGNICVYAMGVVNRDRFHNDAPLAYGPCFYLDLCAKTATTAEMADAQLAAVQSLKEILLAQKADVDTSTVEATALDALFALAKSSYPKSIAVGFAAMRGMLEAAKHDIQMHDYTYGNVLKNVLDKAAVLVPFEVLMEHQGQRIMQIFPPYFEGFEANIPMLLQAVGNKVHAEENEWVNPFSDFSEASSDIRKHFGKIASTQFQNALLRRWILDALVDAIRAHFYLLVSPPDGTDRFINTVEDCMQDLIFVIPLFFKAQTPFPREHARHAARKLAVVAIALLKNNKDDSAEKCVSAIDRIAMDCGAEDPEPYCLADIQQNIEIVAKAADALGKTALGTTFRAAIKQPVSIDANQWPHFLDARQTRLRQLNERIDQFDPRRGGLEDDPVDMLYGILH